ncbi:MAG TPA: hypothetical protein VLM75_08695, partial [Spirochaetota bacterium]|nr:hypothetical protein [Spirochaetota bacterium]
HDHIFQIIRETISKKRIQFSEHGIFIYFHGDSTPSTRYNPTELMIPVSFVRVKRETGGPRWTEKCI